MTVMLTTCTTFNTGPRVINTHSVLKHLTLPLGRNNGMAWFANKATATFPSKNVVSTGQATSTVNHLFLRPGENRLDKHPQNPWEAINGCETGMPLITSWPKDGYYTVNKTPSTDLKTPGRQLTAAKPGCRWLRHGPKTVITQWIRDPLITVHGILDPWCQQCSY